MDFPVDLSLMAPVSSLAELEQCIELLLKEEEGSFLQSIQLGSRVKIHATDSDLIEECVRSTLNQIKGLSITEISVIDFNVELSLLYKDEIAKFKFNVEDLWPRQKIN